MCNNTVEVIIVVRAAWIRPGRDRPKAGGRWSGVDAVDVGGGGGVVAINIPRQRLKELTGFGLSVVDVQGQVVGHAGF